MVGTVYLSAHNIMTKILPTKIEIFIINKQR